MNYQYFYDLADMCRCHYEVMKQQSLHNEEALKNLNKKLYEKIKALKEETKTKPIRQGKIIRLKAG